MIEKRLEKVEGRNAGTAPEEKRTRSKLSTKSQPKRGSGMHINESAPTDKTIKELRSDALSEEKRERPLSNARISNDDDHHLLKSISGNINNLEELTQVIDNRMKTMASK